MQKQLTLKSSFNQRILIFLMFSLCSFNSKIISLNKTSKIVGLIQVRNDSNFIEQCLRSLSHYTDEIVVLDDASEDDTLAIIKSLKEELHITRIIEHATSSWQKRSERYNRQKLLDTGRAIGGTHFILIDADEMFTAHCMKDNWLRKQILSLKKGQMIGFPMMNLWKDADHYRDDALCSPHSVDWNSVMCVLCDDGTCNYDNNTNNFNMSTIIHVSRDPKNRKCVVKKNTIIIDDINFGVLHFKCANLENIATKRAWYMCLEFIRANEQTLEEDYPANAAHINDIYNNIEFKGIKEFERTIILKEVPFEWYNGYNFFNKEKASRYNVARESDIKNWFRKYGISYFEKLDIWNIEWLKALINDQKKK